MGTILIANGAEFVIDSNFAAAKAAMAVRGITSFCYSEYQDFDGEVAIVENGNTVFHNTWGDWHPSEFVTTANFAVAAGSPYVYATTVFTSAELLDDMIIDGMTVVGLGNHYYGHTQIELFGSSVVYKKEVYRLLCVVATTAEADEFAAACDAEDWDNAMRIERDSCMRRFA